MGELEEKIKKELLKSGFPLQILCQRCLLEHDWDILEASEYYISDTDIKKGIDITGISTDKLDNVTDIDYELFIECKKSEDNPWVFFRENNPINTILSSYICAAHEKWPDPCYAKGLHFEKVPSSSIYTMAFKKNRGNQIYEAISSVLLAYHLRQDFLRKHWQSEERENIAISTIIVSFITILFDGKLYLADLEENGTLELTETGSLIYQYKETKATRCYSYSIDIVNKDYFPSYLEGLNKDRKLISDFYRQEISATGA